MAKTKLEELVIELSVENKALVTQLKASQEETNKSMKAMAKSIEKFAKDSNDSVSSFQRVWETAAGFIGGSVVLGAFERAADGAQELFNTMVTDGVAASIEQENALTKLNTALALAGEYSEEASNDFDQWADSLERSTNVSAQTVLGLASLSKGFGFTNEQTKKVTEAAIEFATVADLSVTEALRRLGRTASGSISDVSKYVPELNNMTAAQLRNGEAADLVLKKYGGSAAANIKNFEGSVIGLSNSWGSLTEGLGDVIVHNASVINVLQDVRRQVDEGTESVQDQNDSLKILAGEGLASVLAGLAGLISFADVSVRSLQTLNGVVTALTNPLLKVKVAMAESFGETEENLAPLRQKLKDMQDDLFAFGSAGDGALADIGVRLLELRNAAQEGLEEMRKGMSGAIDVTNRERDSVDQLSAAEKQRAEQAKALALDLLSNTEDYNEQRLELLAEQVAAEQEILDEAYAQGVLSEDQHRAALLALGEKYDKSEEARMRDSEKKKLTIQQQYANQYIALAASTASLINAVAGEQTKAAFLIQRGAAIAQSIVATNVAAAEALAVPPAPNFALAGIARTAGYVNTAAIAATAIQGFNTGGTVPGVGFQDSVLAPLTPGEEIVDKTTSRQLRAFLSGEGGAGQMTIHHTFDFKDLDGFVEVLESKIVERQAIGVSRLKAA